MLCFITPFTILYKMYYLKIKNIFMNDYWFMFPNKLIFVRYFNFDEIVTMKKEYRRLNFYSVYYSMVCPSSASKIGDAAKKKRQSENKIFFTSHPPKAVIITNSFSPVDNASFRTRFLQFSTDI